jgi:ribulose 1,5-bisphosphate synthetase/thiazole synthase
MKKPVRPIARTIVRLFGLSIAALTLPASVAALAADNSVSIVETIEYEDVIVEDSGQGSSDTNTVPNSRAIAQFGPFGVIDAQIVEMNGTIDSTTPDAFRRMIAAYPGIQTIRMIDCPGSVDDDANLALSRMVRRAGINTHVPKDGSIRSGGVEFFLAGVKRTIEPGAEFGVHSWQD